MSGLEDYDPVATLAAKWWGNLLRLAGKLDEHDVTRFEQELAEDVKLRLHNYLESEYSTDGTALPSIVWSAGLPQSAIELLPQSAGMMIYPNGKIVTTKGLTQGYEILREADS